jgi:hypothetical protein
MKLKFIAQVLLTSFAFAGMMAYVIKAEAIPTVGTRSGNNSTSAGGGSAVKSTHSVREGSNSSTPASAAKGTSFNCVAQKDGNYVTVGQRPGGQPIPVVVWTKEGSRYFGEEFSPQVRCDVVTQKINTAVSKNGGSLKNILVTNGVLNGHTVICALGGSDTACNSNNVLFTLKPENAKRVGAILGQLLQISRGAGAGAIHETDDQVYVDLGEWEKQALGTSNAITNPETPADPEPAVNPETPTRNEL